MEDLKLTMTRLLQNTDVMADVLGFLTRKVIALQLASVNGAFSALCSCWCQPEEEEKVETGTADYSDVTTALENVQHRIKNGIISIFKK